MGVTTILKVIGKPFLIPWAVKVALEYVKDNSEMEYKKTSEGEPEENGITGRMIIDEDILKKAKTENVRIMQTAGKWGTKVHKVIEDWIKCGELPKDLDKMQMVAFDNFRKWVADNDVEFIESEKHLWSEKMWVGGICDLVIRIDGKKYIGDIKTSSGIYKEAFFQMGGYNLMLEDMGLHNDIDGYIVINLKKTGEIDLMMATDMDLNKKAFTSALELYKITQSILN